MIGVVDSGLGNIGSVLNMLSYIGQPAVRISSPGAELDECSRIILPGVGSFDVGVENLVSSGLAPALISYARSDRPVLGICLGMQLLFDASEEGDGQGLGLISGKVISMRTQRPTSPIPHVGWNQVYPVSGQYFVQDADGARPRFYFTHSYEAMCDNETDILATADYDGSFTAAVASGNVMGVQFHPEKSHRFGIEFFRQYCGADD